MKTGMGQINPISRQDDIIRCLPAPRRTKGWTYRERASRSRVSQSRGKCTRLLVG